MEKQYREMLRNFYFKAWLIFGLNIVSGFSGFILILMVYGGIVVSSCFMAFVYIYASVQHWKHVKALNFMAGVLEDGDSDDGD